MIREDGDPLAIMKKVDWMMCTVTALQRLHPDHYPNLSYIGLGGEAVPQPLVDLWAPRLKRMYNLFGPTEASVMCHLGILEANKPVTIGKPIPNSFCYVLDLNSTKPAPIGAPGELCIGGIGVAYGYLGMEERTRKSFVPNPYTSDSPYQTMYRTGDLVRWTDGGELTYINRIDHMVKVKGYRVELGEVVRAIESCPSVERAAAIVKDGNLVAFAVPETADEVEIRELIAKRLPRYMIPSILICMPEFPLARGGKVCNPCWILRRATF